MSIALDIAISIAFLYLLLALITTTIQELIASVFNLRARALYNAILGMLEKGKDPSSKLVDAFYRHPLLANLYRSPTPAGTKIDKQSLPSYIPSRVFAVALLDVLRGDATVSGAIGLDKVLSEAQATVGKIQNNDQLKGVLTLLIGDIAVVGTNTNELAAKISKRIEEWFNDRMGRASGWYKRSAQAWAFGLALAAAVVFNADSIRFVSVLWSNGALRDAVVSSAGAYTNAHPTGSGPPTGSIAELGQLAVQQARELASLKLPIGWTWATDHSPCSRGSTTGLDAEKKSQTTCNQTSGGDDVLLVLGWLVTAIAVSLGANFWFDILSKALNIRGTGVRVSETGSVDEKTT